MNPEFNTENIATSIAQLSKEMQHISMPSKEKTRMALIAEETLLSYKKQFGILPAFHLHIKKFFGKVKLTILIKGPSFDYREQLEEESLLNRLISSNVSVQTWKYCKGFNEIHIVLMKDNQLSDVVKLLIAVGIAMLFAFFKKYIPAELNTVLTGVVFPKIAAVFGSVLRMFAGTSIFFSITGCILRFGNMQEIKQVAKTVFCRLALNLLFITAFSSLPLFLFFRIDNSTLDFNWTNVFDLFADMIPPDFLTPFMEGNMIQISLIALLFGGAIVVLNLQNTPMGKSVVSLQQVSQLFMELLCRLLPLFVFVNLVSAVSTTSMASVLQVLLPITSGIVMVVLIIILEAVEVGLLHHISVIDFCRKALPGTLVCLTTASTAAALPAIKRDLMQIGVEESDISFLLPLEQAFYKPFTLAIVFPGVIAVYRIFGIQPSLSAHINLLILAFIIAIACPPVPGGMLSCLTVLCLQLNLPEGAMAVLILISTVMDYVGGALSAFSFHAEITGIAYRKRRKQTGKG